MIYLLAKDHKLRQYFISQYLPKGLKVVEKEELHSIKNKLKVNDILFIDLSFIHENDIFMEIHNFQNAYFIIKKENKFQIIPIHMFKEYTNDQLKNWIRVQSFQIPSKKENIPFIIKDKRMQYLVKSAQKVSRIDAPIIIFGETGTGKEFIARYIFQNSNRSNKPFVVVNCAAIPSSLMESELFGYRKGAFTGADKDYPGKFALANGGTIFLDEIGEIPLDLQAKLLRVLDYGEIETLGETKPFRVDVRLITATNRNLEEMVQKGLFRSDLFFRINNFVLTIPPLRERQDDILEMFYFYLSFYQKKYSTAVELEEKKQIERLLLEYPWPGNVRELRNLCQSLVILSNDGKVTKKLVEELMEFSGKVVGTKKGPLQQQKQKAERELILEALKAYDYNISQTAKYLGISRQHLYRKIKNFKIEVNKR